MSDKTQPPKGQRGAAVREKILDTVNELFYREGIRAVGVDAVVAHSGVAKTTLYRWFPTKDDLIAAYLERRDQLFWAQWDKVAVRHRADPYQELLAQLTWLARYIASGDYRGCAFINTATEFPELERAARVICMANKRTLRNRLLLLVKAIGVPDAELVADQLMLLVDGAFANAQVMGTTGSAPALVNAGKAIIDAALTQNESGKSAPNG